MTGRMRSVLALCVGAVVSLLWGAAPAWAMANPQEHVSDVPIFQVHGVTFLTKFLILELLAAGLLMLIFIPLARRAAHGGVGPGPLAELLGNDSVLRTR